MLPALAFSTMGQSTPVAVITVTLLFNGLALGLWNVPNNSTIIGAAPASDLGVVGALTNLTRNVGNVTGQALASAVVAAVMVARGFDIPLGELRSVDGAGTAFVDGWRVVFRVVAGLSLLGFVATARTTVTPPTAKKMAQAGG